MPLIDEIIQLAVDDKSRISTLLRSCLVLAYKLDNAKLKAWIERELNGYAQTDEIPDYRKVSVMAKGFFANMVRQINDQPLPPSILQKEHRHFAETAILTQPIAAYEPPQHATTEKTYPVIGNVVIADHAHDIKQVGTIIIAKNDLPALEAALKGFGIAEPDITELRAALDHDAVAQHDASPSLGQLTGDWLRSAASKIASSGTKMGGEVVKDWILQYLGLS